MDTNFYTVDTGAGLIFKIRRTDNGSNTQSPGDIASLLYKGVQYQDQSRGSQLNGGFDYVYSNTSAVNISAEVVNTNYIKITVIAGEATHYYLAKKGSPHIYMGTYFTREPDTLGFVRFILRTPVGVLPNGPTPSDIRNTTSTVESADIFSLPNGETRSKHYSNMRLKDWDYIGATGTNVGLWVVRGNNEGGSGGPFYRSLLNQCTSTNQEITYIVNYGEAQTENFRTGILNTYTLVFTDGITPSAVNTDWFSDMNLTGYVPANDRGRLIVNGVSGRDTTFNYTAGFSNSSAQYWATMDASTGSFDSGDMLPGIYTMKIYKNELAVDTRDVTVNAGTLTAINSIAITNDPSTANALWRIGNWDGTPTEFINGDKLTTMHPSDIRMSSWVVPNYIIGVAKAATDFPAYQWKDVNGSIAIKFTLTAAQIKAYTLRVGITIAYSGARPKASLNSWTGTNPTASTQPTSRSLTVGTYRGNNSLFTFNIPASAFVVGENTLWLSAISGSSGIGFLSPGYAYDAVDLISIP